ncbi:hypothetical protein Lal_00003369 [Lupinus albus]|nr:hypothetical protein Lal_00003369 [Lupinus albus]
MEKFAFSILYGSENEKWKMENGKRNRRKERKRLNEIETVINLCIYKGRMGPQGLDTWQSRTWKKRRESPDHEFFNNWRGPWKKES